MHGEDTRGAFKNTSAQTNYITQSQDGTSLFFKATGVMFMVRTPLQAENSTGLAKIAHTINTSGVKARWISDKKICYVMKRVQAEKGADFTSLLTCKICFYLDSLWNGANQVSDVIE